VFAALGLFAGLVTTWTSKSEVGARYRTATISRLGVMGVAFVAYVYIIAKFDGAYSLVGTSYVPNATAFATMAPRYMEWGVSVPLLVVELLCVTTLFGDSLRRTRAFAVTCTFLMIFTGYLGAIVFDDENSAVPLLVWGGISCVFWIIVTLVLIRAVRRSMATLTPDSGVLLRKAAVVLLSGWVVYPIIYAIQIFAFGGQWTATIQIALCLADVGVKVGFGTLVHRVAKLRTAEDVRAGSDVHPEAIWISSQKQSDAGSPREVYIADDSVVHQRRSKPAESYAVASADEVAHLSEFD
jgi:bacteriorhodopsin